MAYAAISADCVFAHVGSVADLRVRSTGGTPVLVRTASASGVTEFDPRTGAATRSYGPPHTGKVAFASVLRADGSADQRLVFVSAGSELSALSTKTAGCVRRFERGVHTGEVTALMMLGDRRLVSGARDHRVVVPVRPPVGS